MLINSVDNSPLFLFSIVLVAGPLQVHCTCYLIALRGISKHMIYNGPCTFQISHYPSMGKKQSIQTCFVA